MGRGVSFAGLAGVRRARPGLRALLSLLLLVPAVASPAAIAAGSGPTRLSDPSASPGAGYPTTTITVAVTYENREGSAPDYVRVVVAGAAHEMRATTASDSWRKGVRYAVNLTLPAGRHTTLFQAADRERFTDEVAGPTITIRPQPTPAPTPTPKPTPKPTAAPTARPTPKPTPPTPPPTRAPVPTASATAVPATPPAPPATSTPSAPVAPGATAPVTPAPTAAPTPSPTPSATPVLGAVVPPVVPAGPGDGGATPPGPTDGGGGPASPFDAGPGRFLRIVPVAVATTGTVTMLMAFLVFGKRRRDEQPTASDEALAQAAATGPGMIATGSLVPAVPEGAPAAQASAIRAAVAPTPGLPPDTEAHLPRWRRPSLLEARKADPTRTVSQGIRLTFDPETVATAPDAERRVIRYRLVSLLDLPDEVHGHEIGVLDEGDEVVLLEKRGTYWRVLCPDGREGWLHKMTLGDVVIGSSVSGGGTSWTSGDEGPSGFEDVLRAYRARRGELSEG